MPNRTEARSHFQNTVWFAEGKEDEAAGPGQERRAGWWLRGSPAPRPLAACCLQVPGINPTQPSAVDKRQQK